MMTPRRVSAIALLSLAPAFSFAQCATVFTEDTATVYLGYEPLSCAELTPWITGNGPYMYVWSTGATVPVITICTDGPGWYSVSATDMDGCVSGDSIFVDVVDVRCGNNMNKVAVCHIPPGNPANAHSICISENGVPAHLAHGCRLGICSPDSLETDSLPQADVDLLVAPNPMVEDAYVQLETRTQENVLVTLVDAMGRTRAVIFSGLVQPETPMNWPLQPSQLNGDLFWVRCATASGKCVSTRVLRVE